MSEPQKRRRPARSVEQRENELINLSMDAAEKMLKSGNPPAQVVTHYLKLGSSSEKLAQLHKEEEIKLLRIKAETYASQRRTEELMAEALNAFKAYSGTTTSDEGEFDG